MATLLNPQITEAGKEAAVNASNSGFEISITHIAFGRGYYEPVGDETALQDEIVRLPIAFGAKITPTQVRMAAVWADALLTEQVQEIGFFSGSVLFAVWSRPSGVPIAIKTPGIDLVAFYDLALVAVPPGSVNITVDPDASAVLAALGAHEVDPDAHPQYLLRSQLITGHSEMWCTATGSNALTITPPAGADVAVYVPGMRLTFKATADNTGAVTANVAGVGAVAVTKRGATALTAGDIKTGAIYDLLYDGVQFQLAGGVGGGGSAYDPYEFTATEGQTVFTVAYAPGNIRVIRNGRTLSPSEYSATNGTSVSLLSPANDGDQILIEVYTSLQVIEQPKVYGIGMWKVIATGSTLVAGDTFVPDNGAGACSYLLPATPQDGDAVEWIASETGFSANAMTIQRNGRTIMGLAEDMTVTTDNTGGRLVWRAALNTWRVYAISNAGEV